MLLIILAAAFAVNRINQEEAEKLKNKKINLGGPSKRKAPKKFGANRAQQKAKSKAKRKK